MLPSRLKAQLDARHKLRREAKAYFESLPGYAQACVTIHEQREAFVVATDQRRVRSPEMLEYALRIVDINAGAMLELINDIEGQRFFKVMLEYWADWAWSTHTGTPADLYPPMPRVGPFKVAADEIAAKVRYWQNEGFKRIAKRERGNAVRDLPWHSSSKVPDDPITPVSGRGYWPAPHATGQGADRDKEEEKVQPPPCATTDETATNLPRNSIGTQLEALRKECRWTIQELADAVDLDIRNVQRHLASHSKPSTRNIGSYERVFSKQLKRQVVVEDSP